MQYFENDCPKVRRYSIEDFSKLDTKYKGKNNSVFGYHMKTNKIDWIQPIKGRDRFILMTKKTRDFYGL